MNTTTVGSVQVTASTFTGQKRGSGRVRGSSQAMQCNKATSSTTGSPGGLLCAGMALGALGKQITDAIFSMRPLLCLVQLATKVKLKTKV